MNFTAILCTLRKEPKFDWMADSFANALAKHPNIKVELIVVDGQLWYMEDRREQLADAVAGRFPYKHIEPKPTPWQGPERITSRDHFALCNARNTALIAMTTGHAAFFDDCIVLDPDWTYWHNKAAEKGIAMCGSFRSYTTASVVNGEIACGVFHPAGEKDSRDQTGNIKRGYGSWMWGLNISFPLSYSLMANGYDEHYDGAAGVEDCDKGCRLERLGCPIIYNPKCMIYQVLETHAPVGGHAGWNKPQPRKPKERTLSTGRVAYANELAIEEMAVGGWTASRGNNFDLGLARVAYHEHGVLPEKNPLTHDWRDGQLLEDM